MNPYLNFSGARFLALKDYDVSSLFIGTQVPDAGTGSAYKLATSNAAVDHDNVESVKNAPELRWLKVGTGSGTVQSIVEGANVTVNASDPANPIISASGGPGLNPHLQFVSPTGNDAHSGLDWTTAKQTIPAAYDALSPLGGEIHFAEGSAGPLWIRGDGWSLTGWKQAMPLRLVGHGNSVADFALSLACQMTGASLVDRLSPLLWVAGITGVPITFENVMPAETGGFSIANTPYRAGWDYNREINGAIAWKNITSWHRTTPGGGPPGVAVVTVQNQTAVPIVTCTRDASDVVTLHYASQYPKRTPRFASFVTIVSTDSHFPSGTYTVLTQPTDDSLTYQDTHVIGVQAGTTIGTWASHGINANDVIEVLSTDPEVVSTRYKVASITATTITVVDYYGFSPRTPSPSPISNPGTYVLEDRSLYPIGQIDWRNIQGNITEIDPTDRFTSGPTFDMGSTIDARLRLIDSSLGGDFSQKITDPDRSCWLLCDSGSHGNSTGMNIYSARPSGTGIRFYATPSAGSGVVIRELQGDLGVGSIIQYPTLEVVNGSADCFLDCERVSTADATGAVPSFITTGMDPGNIRLISCGANASAGNIDGLEDSRTWSTAVIDSPAKMKQVCWWADQRVAGKTAASFRTNVGIASPRYTNLVDDPAAWTFNTIVPTYGQPDPAGGTGAIALACSGQHDLVPALSTLFIASAGDRWVFGCWIKRTGGLKNGLNAAVLEMTFPGSDNAPFDAIAACPFLGDGEWQWITCSATIVNATVPASHLAPAIHVDTQCVIYAPTINRIPSGDMTDNEFAEYVQTFRPQPSLLRGGVSGTMDNVPFIADGGLGTKAALTRTVGVTDGQLTLGSVITYEPRFDQSGHNIIGWLPVYSAVINGTIPTGQILWLKADEIAGSDGDSIALWSDASGNGNDATQSTAGFRPKLKTGINGLNSLNVLRFDGVDDAMNATFDMTAAPGITIFYAARRNNDVLNGHNIILSSGTATAGPAGWAFTLSNIAAVTDAGAGGPAVNIGLGTMPGVAKGNGYAQSYRSNKTAWTLKGVNNSTTPDTSFPSGTFNAEIGWLDNGGAGIHLEGDIAEIIVYPTALSNGDRDTVLSYLRTKWGAS